MVVVVVVVVVLPPPSQTLSDGEPSLLCFLRIIECLRDQCSFRNDWIENVLGMGGLGGGC